MPSCLQKRHNLGFIFLTTEVHSFIARARLKSFIASFHSHGAEEVIDVSSGTNFLVDAEELVEAEGLARHRVALKIFCFVLKNIKLKRSLLGP